MREPVVEPGGGPAAEIRPDRVMNRSRNLKSDEHDADQCERWPRLAPCSIVPTSQPIAIANTAGSSPRTAMSAHHRAASPLSASVSTPANFHSLRHAASRTRRSLRNQCRCAIAFRDQNIGDNIV